MEDYVICDAYVICDWHGKCHHKKPHIKDSMCDINGCNCVDGNVSCSPVNTVDILDKNEVDEWFREIEL